MKIWVFTQPNCTNCQKVEQILEEMGVEFEKKNIGLSSDWRNDGSVENMALYSELEIGSKETPVIAFVEEGALVLALSVEQNGTRGLKKIPTCEDGVCAI